MIKPPYRRFFYYTNDYRLKDCFILALQILINFNHMKKLFCFLAVITTALLTSCSNDDDSGNNSAQEASITLIPSAESIFLGESVTFTVKDQDGNTVSALITYNNISITNPWTGEAIGTYTFKATYYDVTDTATVTVKQPESTITLTPSAESIFLGQAVTFTVKDQEGTTLTDAEITYNGEPVTNMWIGEAIGTHTFTATYNGSTDTATVIVEQNENTFMIEGVEYDTNQNILIYIGTIGDAGHNYWALSSAKVDTEGDEPGVVNISTIIFTTQQTGQELVFPSTGQTLSLVNNPNLLGTQGGAITFDTDNETDMESVTGLDLTINALNLSENPTQQTINYDFSMELEQILIINGTFNGPFEFINAAGRGTASKQIAPVSKADIMQKIKVITSRRNITK